MGTKNQNKFFETLYSSQFQRFLQRDDLNWRMELSFKKKLLSHEPGQIYLRTTYRFFITPGL